MAMRTSPPPTPPQHAGVSTFWTWLALVLALIGSAGTLYMSLGNKLEFGMDLLACPLCFYQRTFMLAVAAVLLAGLFAGPRQSGFLSLVTFPLTVAGLGIAGYHVYLEYDGKLNCPTGALVQLDEEFRGKDELHQTLVDYDSAPRESLAIFALLFLVQIVDLLRSASRGGFAFGALLAGLILGGLLATGAIFTAGNCKIQQQEGESRGCVPVPGK